MVINLKKLTIVFSLLLLIGVSFWYYKELKTMKNAKFIIINKADMTLSQYDYKGELLHKFKVATGKNYGNKAIKGDCKTPEGVFTIEEVLDASTWSHDFKDDKGTIKGAYGPYFIRLRVPGQKGIGIHGTHDNNSLGKRASEGCIRLNNHDLNQLVENINTNSVVVITPGIDDININANPTLPNNTDKAVKAEKLILKKVNPLKEGNKLILKTNSKKSV
ncbi:L,D-transpeptidase [Flavobacterium sp. LB2P6]|uniref:L,D-transpeptidase n=1 Tax=Flavobacterium sp. LB2P6 TaxID=3401714 RepID=UPI003AAE2563